MTSSNAVLQVFGAPQLLKIIFTNSSTRVSFTSVSGRNYALEFKDHHEDASWTSLPTVPGNGGLLTLTNVTAVPVRFYRVRVE